MTIQEAPQHALKVLWVRRPYLPRSEAHAMARVLLDNMAGVSHVHLQALEHELETDTCVDLWFASNPVEYLSTSLRVYELHQLRALL